MLLISMSKPIKLAPEISMYKMNSYYMSSNFYTISLKISQKQLKFSVDKSIWDYIRFQADSTSINEGM